MGETINMKKFLPALFIILTSCTITQTVDKVKISTVAKQSNICVINHPSTRDSFQTSLTRAIKRKGYKTEVVNQVQDFNCPMYVTYVGKWSWDLTTYMSYADIKVFDGSNQQLGHAHYDATSKFLVGFSKFINADDKINELVDELFSSKGD